MERSTADWAPQLWRDDEEREGEAQLGQVPPSAHAEDPQTLNPNSASSDPQSAEQGVSSTHSVNQRRVLSEAGGDWSRLKHGTHPLRVLFLRRDAKLVHPRQQDPSFMEMRITNQEGVIGGMQLWAVKRGGGMQVLGRSELRGNGRSGGYRRRLMEGVGRKGRNTTSGMIHGERGSQSKRVIRGRSRACTEVGCKGKRILSGLDERERDLVHLATSPVTGQGKRRVLAEAIQGKRLVFFINGTVAAWSFEEQLAAMQWADIIVGPHGAGLTHVLYLRPHSALIEMRGSGDERDHYELLAHVRGLQYVRIPTSGSEDEMVRGIVQAIDFLTTP